MPFISLWKRREDLSKYSLPANGMPYLAPLLVQMLFITLLVTSCTTSTPTRPQTINLAHRHAVQTTTVLGHTLAYLDEGQGPPIILLHGFGGSMWQWEHQQEALAKDHRVITPDMLGSGLSDKPDIDYSPAFLLNAFTEFMDNMGIPQATLVGNSMGAALAIGMALTHPERVSKLVLISGFPAKIAESIASSSYKRFIDSRPPIWLARIGLWLTGRWATKRILTEIIYDPTLVTPIVIERSYQNRKASGFLPPLYSQIEHIPDWEKDFGPRLKDITQPTFIIWGDQDRVFPSAVGQTMHDTIPHSMFFQVSNSGHIPQWERPEIVNPALLQFFNQIH